MASQLIGNKDIYTYGLMFMQGVMGTVPVVHIEDVCEAHIFCMEKEGIKGRYICAAGDLTVNEMTNFYAQNFPHIKIGEGFMGEGVQRGTRCIVRKLKDMGFEYKHDVEKTLKDNTETMLRLGDGTQASQLIKSETKH